MLVNSTAYLVFFVIVAGITFFSPARIRWVVLLTASLYFYYYWNPLHLGLLVLLTLINYWGGLLIGKRDDKSNKKVILIPGLIINIGVLAFFKYISWGSQLISGVNSSSPTGQDAFSAIIFPLGLSFYIFKLLAYIFDVYNSRIQPERHVGKFLLFVLFFPTLIAGPIERAGKFLPQISRKFTFRWQKITPALLLIAWGFFKKLVIADRLAIIVNNVYDQPGEFSAIPLIVATYFYAIQIYADFSGYSDIAIGSASLLGFDITNNFRQPYFAESIGDFWRRWHISLSNWFRDYVFFPLERKRDRNNNLGQHINVLIVFVLTGIWHGSTLNFLLWGGLHGVLIVSSNLINSLKSKFFPDFEIIRSEGFRKFLNIGITFQFIAFSWVLFRANSIADLGVIFKQFTNIQIRSGYGLNIGGVYEVIILGTSLVILFLVDFFRERGKNFEFIAQKPLVIRWLVYYGLFFSILLFGKLGVVEFIYRTF